jgi:hypothetical protein
MTQRYMLDTVASENTGVVPGLPKSVRIGGKTLTIALQAGYVNGRYAWKSRHPDVWIDVNGSDPRAHVVDCENGDATPDQTVPWAKEHNALKTEFPAVIYCDRSNLTPVFNAMNGAGLKVARDFFLWIATLDGTESVRDMTGVVAIQAFGSADLGFNADLSVVYNDNFPHGAPAPVSGPFRKSVPSGNTLSLDRIVANRNGDLHTIIDLTRANLSPLPHLTDFDNYLDYDNAHFATFGEHATISAHSIYYTLNN